MQRNENDDKLGQTCQKPQTMEGQEKQNQSQGMNSYSSLSGRKSPMPKNCSQVKPKQQGAKQAESKPGKFSPRQFNVKVNCSEGSFGIPRLYVDFISSDQSNKIAANNKESYHLTNVFVLV